MPSVGQILRERELVTDEQLNETLHLQRKQGSRMGDIMVGEGVLGYLPLYAALAEHYDLPFVDLLKEPPDAALFAQQDFEDYLRLRALPWRRIDGHMQVVICDKNPDVLRWAEKQFGKNVRYVFTSPLDIRRSIETAFGQVIETQSRLSLWQRMPQYSARHTLPPHYKATFHILLVLAALSMVLWPIHSALAFIAICHIAYTITMVFKSWAFTRGRTGHHTPGWPEKLASLDERTLPIYTVLIPMYKEAASLPGMLAALSCMDYPPSKLDIKLVLEFDDKETLQAAHALKPHYHFDIIRVPASELRTKPKACNYALRFARGELLTVFDADDRPDPLQLKKAVYAFRRLPKDIVCLQARLNYYNGDDNWLTRFFSLEYAMLFDHILPGLERMQVPIPLGGTSNHFAITRLKELGEWDPYNVTEDADLGARLAARGYKTVMLDSITMEEAPNRTIAWIKQRSRWIKGYMQTWLVHMRRPIQLYRSLGMRGFIGFQCFIGLSCFTFLTAPITWLLSALWIGELAHWHNIVFPGWLAWLTGINLGLNIITHWYLPFYTLFSMRVCKINMVISAFTYPLYLILHSIASYKALWQLIKKPHFWEKTTHGLAKQNALTASPNLR